MERTGNNRNLGRFSWLLPREWQHNITALVSVFAAKNVRVLSSYSTLDDHQRWHTVVNKLKII
jgi:hypothetical protein